MLEEQKTFRKQKSNPQSAPTKCPRKQNDTTPIVPTKVGVGMPSISIIRKVSI